MRKFFINFSEENVLIVKALFEVMNRVTRYKMSITEHGCLILVFYLPARNMLGKHVQTSWMLCVACISAEMHFVWQGKYRQHFSLCIQTNFYLSSVFFVFFFGCLIFSPYIEINFYLSSGFFCFLCWLLNLLCWPSSMYYVKQGKMAKQINH